MKEKENKNVGILNTVGSGKESDNSAVFVKDNILIFNNEKLLNALDPTTKSALKALVSVGAAKVPEGVVL